MLQQCVCRDIEHLGSLESLMVPWYLACRSFQATPQYLGLLSVLFCPGTLSLPSDLVVREGLGDTCHSVIMSDVVSILTKFFALLFLGFYSPSCSWCYQQSVFSFVAYWTVGLKNVILIRHIMVSKTKEVKHKQFTGQGVVSSLR